jgi:hypothetical protein
VSFLPDAETAADWPVLGSFRAAAAICIIASVV